MTDLETRLRRDLDIAANDVRISGDAWQQHQERVAAASTARARRAALVAASAAGVVALSVALPTQLGDRDSAPAPADTPSASTESQQPATPTATPSPTPSESTQQPTLASTSLLITDELPGTFATWRQTGNGEGEPEEAVTSCQQGTLDDLGATMIRHLSWVDESEYAATARQVTMQFSSGAEARKTFDTVEPWFDRCKGVLALTRHDAITLDNARAQGVDLLRAAPGNPNPRHQDEGRLEVGTFAISDDSIALFSYKPVRTGMQGATSSATARLILERLAGRRTLTANALPDDLRFTEERKWPRRQEGKNDGAQRSRSLAAAGWLNEPCNVASSVHALPIGALRVENRVNADDSALDNDRLQTRELVLYANEKTARTVAKELVAQFACEPPALEPNAHPDDRRNFEAMKWKVSDTSGAQGIYTVASRGWIERFSNKPAEAYAVIQRGNAVFVAFARFRVEDSSFTKILLPEVRADVHSAVERNFDAVCRVATGC